MSWVDQYDNQIKYVSDTTGTPVSVIKAIMQIETSGDPNAVSYAGAQGLGQFMPETAADLEINPFDPNEAIYGIGKHMKALYDNLGSWELAAAGYNAGGGAVQNYHGVPPYEETQNYVKKFNQILGQSGAGEGYSGNIFNDIGQQMGAEISNGIYEEQQDYLDPSFYETTKENPTFWSALGDNFLDSVTSTGFASILQSVWGNIAHSSNHLGRMDDITQEDIDYVKNALPNDKQSQEFILLNGRDREEIQWLVNQKLVDKKRREAVEQWRNDNELSVRNALPRLAMATAGGAGMLIDPINLIPLGGQVRALRLAKNLGEATYDVVKAKAIAQSAAEVAAKSGAVMVADDAAKANFGGEKVNYLADAVAATVFGGVLGGLGGIMATRSGSVAREVALSANKGETLVLNHAIKGEIPVHVKSETIERALKLHDTTFGSKLKSDAYSTLEKNKRVIATTYENMRKLMSKAANLELPKTAKALYVPNEDYAVILTDKVSPKEVDKLLTHELAVHAGLQKTIGDKAYGSLMLNVQKQSKKEGTAAFEARQRAGSYDPEEIFAQMVEDGTLPDTMWSRLKGALHKKMNSDGYKATYSMDDIKELFRAQVEESRNPVQYHRHADGTTAFAGIRYSQDNILNPVLRDYIELEPTITKETQKDIPKLLRGISKRMEQGIFGLGVNSVSNTLRKYTPMIWEDARGRGLGHMVTMCAEKQKQQLLGQLMKPFEEAGAIRWEWMKKNRKLGYAGCDMFNQMAVSRYNAKYASNKACPIRDVPQEVESFVDKIHEYRTKQIELAKQSASMFGSDAKNMVEPDWYVVNDELWRMVDKDKRSKFVSENFINTHKESAQEQCEAELENYVRTFAIRDKIKEQLLRDIKLHNKRIQASNDAMAERLGEDSPKYKPQELLKEYVSEEDIDKHIDEHAKATVKQWLAGSFDPADVGNLGKLGELSFFKYRLPIDTTGVMKLSNGREFSFDNNLRSFDLDAHVIKNMNRFAGEAALKNVFHNEKGLQKFFSDVSREINYAIDNGKANKSAMKDFIQLKKSIAEFRGTRAQDEAAMNRLGVLGHIGRNLAYAKRGWMMGVNQLAEVGNTIAYGGAAQAMQVTPLAKFVERVKYGKDTAEIIRDIEDMTFGEAIENHIWTHNFRDMTVHDVLTEKDSISNATLTWLADKTQYLGKITSTINGLPKLTDMMVRGMRRQTMMDSLRVAWGDTNFSVAGLVRRDPFSKAKLKAAHIDEDEWHKIKSALIRYSESDVDGHFTKFDVKGFERDEPFIFAKWKNMIQLQAERAIVSATSQGNKNLFKSTNSLTQLMFQFKDYTLRAINAQTFRALTARDTDDALATLLSIATNTATYAARAGMLYAGYKAAGLDKKAEEYYDRMFNQDALLRAAATRSAYVGSLVSFPNDIYEAMTGAASVRSTVNRTSGQKPFFEQNPSDFAGNVIAQFPAFQELVKTPYDILRVIDHAATDRMSKRDMRDVINGLLPVATFLPLTILTQKLSEMSGLPDKSPKK